MKNIIIRKALSSDARSIIELTTYTWLTTYKGLMPDELLESRLNTIDERTQQTKESLEKKILEKRNNTFVAEVDGKVVGMLGYGKSRNENYSDSGEIYAIYVLKDYQGYGIGKKLFMTGIKTLIEQGYNSMILNVLEGNKTIHFYEKYGGKNVDSKTDNFAGVDLTENVMFFDNLKKIYNENRIDLQK